MEKELQNNSIKMYVHGMHCHSCEVFIKSTLSKDKTIKNLKTNLSDLSIQFEADGIKPEDFILINSLRNKFNSLLKNSDYTIELNPNEISSKNMDYKELLMAFLLATSFAILFLLLQKTGLVNFLNAESVTLPFVFIVGVIASLSSCMAVVGGLIFSISASIAKNNESSKSQILTFHISRLLSFFVLGGVIGTIGKMFEITPQINLILNLFLFAVMGMLGLNMLEMFKIKPIVFNGHAELTNFLLQKGTILLGIATFFLPCGFTQAMQITALSSGSAVTGATTMLVFALGTLPALLLLSFASFSFSKMKYSELLFKTSGFIVIFFAIFNLLGALAANGITPPLGL